MLLLLLRWFWLWLWSWGQVEPIFGLCGAVLSPIWVYVGPSRAYVGPPWAHVSPARTYVGPSWAHIEPTLGPCWPILNPCYIDFKACFDAYVHAWHAWSRQVGWDCLRVPPSKTQVMARSARQSNLLQKVCSPQRIRTDAGLTVKRKGVGCRLCSIGLCFWFLAIAPRHLQ